MLNANRWPVNMIGGIEALQFACPKRHPIIHPRCSRLEWWGWVVGAGWVKMECFVFTYGDRRAARTCDKSPDGRFADWLQFAPDGIRSK